MLSDPYSSLGIARGASPDEIKKAFKSLALKYHPDRHATSTAAEQAAAVEKFKHIKQAYELLIDGRKRAAYEAGTSSSSSAQHRHHNVNTDWSRYSSPEWERPAYSSRMSQWEMLRRSLRMNLRQFDRTLHVGLGAILLGGFLTFEYVHGAVWRLHNAGKSFEEMQARQAGLRATQAASAASAAGGGSGNAGSAASGSDEEGAASSVPGERRGQRTKHSVWADNLRGRFVEDPDSKAEPPPVQQTAGSSGTSTQPRQQLATPGSASGSGGVAVGTRGAASGKGSSGYVDRAVVLPAPSPAGQMGGHAVRRGASDQQ